MQLDGRRVWLSPSLPCPAMHSPVTAPLHPTPATAMQTVFFRNYTTQAAKQIPDDSLDFIYVDAR